MQIIVDLSRASAIGDMRPNRLAVMAGVLQGFIRKFFDENPLSHLGLIIMRNGIAERLTELAGSPVRGLLPLQACHTALCEGITMPMRLSGVCAVAPGIWTVADRSWPAHCSML